MATYFTTVATNDVANAAYWNSQLGGLDDQLVLLTAGSGFDNQAANKILAGPTSGGSGAVTFRSLVAADIPFSAPGAIGSVTPAAGTFTTLTANTSVRINGGGSGAVEYLDGNAGTTRSLVFRTGTSNRWVFQVNGTAEGGSDAGSDFLIGRYDDAGSYLGAALQITRSNGAVNIVGNLDHDGSNIGFFGTAPTTKKTVTGSRGGNAALASLLTQLAAYGLITDSSS
ncbi:MAG: hypothetical protein K8L99_26230 [Anaerolineae bacterium]|nr:hypothetical protein [Anaerolineae bacterium]